MHIPETNVLLLLFGVVMALIKVVETLAAHRKNGNGHSKIDCFRPEDREDLHAMARIIGEEKWDGKLDAIHSDNKELLREIKMMVAGMLKHFDEFQCLARKLPHNKEE